jgi:dipeptidyl aminopeptidase/acylaminoacyl peptidase
MAFGARRASRFAAACGFAAWLIPVGAHAGHGLQIESFFRTPEFDEVVLSPSGRYLAAITRLKQLPEGRNIVVFDVDAASARAITAYDRSDVDWFVWAGDDRIVFKREGEYSASAAQNMYTGVYSVQRDGKGGVRLDDPKTGERRGRASPRRGLSVQEQVDRVPGARASQLGMLITKRDMHSARPEVYRVDFEHGGLTRVVANHHDIRKWIADNAGRVRVGIGAPSARDLRQILWYRPDDVADWKPVLEFELQDLEVLGFQSDDRRLLVASRVGRERFALLELDPESGRYGSPLVEDAEYDVYHRGTSYLARAPDGRPLFYQYMADKPRTVFFDKSWRERQAAIDGTLDDTVNTIVGWSDDEQRFLVYSWSDRQPGRYLLYEPGRKRLEELISTRSWIDPQTMQPTQPIRLKARDGVLLHGYLTLPAKTGRLPPLVVVPHGGPFGVRDSWGFDPGVQFLADRGYAVLQVAFRGSGGYGRSHEHAGYHRWGLEMQDDLADAVVWTGKQGYVDTTRVCIYGAGYGGYAALMGLIRTPRLYRCGIDYGGPVDLPLYFRSNVSDGPSETDDAARTWWRMTIGDPGENVARFFDTSPIMRVNEIQAPVLVIHGQLDGRVQIEHYKRLITELEKRRKPYDAMVKEHEGYGVNAEANQVELYEKVEEFLAEHLASGRAEAGAP